jgi:hypothetical protein
MYVYVVENLTGVVGYFDSWEKAQKAVDVLCSLTSRAHKQNDLSIVESPFNEILDYDRPPCAYAESEQMAFS